MNVEVFFKDLARPYSLVPRNGTCGTVRVGRVGFACGRPGPGDGAVRRLQGPTLER